MIRAEPPDTQRFRVLGFTLNTEKACIMLKDRYIYISICTYTIHINTHGSVDGSINSWIEFRRGDGSKEPQEGTVDGQNPA